MILGHLAARCRLISARHHFVLHLCRAHRQTVQRKLVLLGITEPSMRLIFLLGALAVCLVRTELAVAQGNISSTAFNPALSLILDGKFTSYSGAPPELTGVLQGGENGAAPEGFSLSDTEVVASANIDDKFYGFVNIGFELDENETEVELEEAWLQTLSLPGGFGVKAGRFFSDIGYLNIRHPHAWDFANAPLAYAAFLGTSYADTGVQVRWIAPLDVFLEVGGEIMSGDSFPAGGRADSGTGAHTLFARLGGDAGVSNSWRVGVSFLTAESIGRESMLGTAPVGFDGDTDVTMFDFVWKWARNGNLRDRNLTVIGEYLRRDEKGALTLLSQPPLTVAYDDNQSGFYLYGTYQFRPQWRAGVRFDRLSLSTGLSSLPGVVVGSNDPERWSLMLDWSNSEFSRLRLQIDSTDLSGRSSTGLVLQYVMSIGAHGAHTF